MRHSCRRNPKPNYIMPASIKLTDKFTVTVTGNTPKEIIQGASFWLNDFPKQCGNCQSTDIAPRHRRTKGFDFYEARCAKCHHSVKISETKEDHSFFIRWDAKWLSPQQAYAESSGSSQPSSSDPDAAW